MKPLTQPNPFPFRRSSSRCRDTNPDIDPRIRASVDRLSVPRKREVGETPKKVEKTRTSTYSIPKLRSSSIRRNT